MVSVEGLRSIVGCLRPLVSRVLNFHVVVDSIVCPRQIVVQLGTVRLNTFKRAGVAGFWARGLKNEISKTYLWLEVFGVSVLNRSAGLSNLNKLAKLRPLTTTLLLTL
jgi:hypothetical protein